MSVIIVSVHYIVNRFLEKTKKNCLLPFLCFSPCKNNEELQRCVTGVFVRVRPVGLKADRVALREGEILAAKVEKQPAFLHNQVLHGLFAMGDAGINAPRLHTDRVNFKTAVLLIWEIGKSLIVTFLFFCWSDGLLPYKIALIHGRRNQFHKVDAQSAGDFSERCKRRVCFTPLDLPEHAFADARFNCDGVEAHLFSFPDPA